MASGTIQNNAIKSDYVDYNYTIAAGATGNTNLKTLIDAKMPSGGTFIGISGYSSNAGSVVASSIRYVNSDYSLQFINLGTTSQTRQFRVYFLYI